MKDARKKEPHMAMALLMFMTFKKCAFSRTVLTLPKGRAFVLDMVKKPKCKHHGCSPMVAKVLAQYKIVTGLLNRRAYANTTTDAGYALIRLILSQQLNW